MYYFDIETKPKEINYDQFTMGMLEDMLRILSSINYTKNKINNKMNENVEKLYVRESDIPKTNTRIAFIRKFVEKRPTSYSDESCTQQQCENGRYRSITELHKIVLSRFPKTSFEAILRIVKDLINDEKPITMVYCTTVNKVVLRYLDKGSRQYMSDYSIKNFYEREGVDGYSLKDYSEIIEKL